MKIPMNEGVVALVTRLMEGTAVSLERSLEQLGYPNACRHDAPFNEANVISHLAATLRDQQEDSLFYAEVPIDGGGRIDLLARIKNVNLLIEAKGLGDVDRCDSLQNQLKRFDYFAPSFASRKDKGQHNYWHSSPSFGLAIIASHRGISAAWKANGSVEAANIFSGKAIKPKSAAKARREVQSLKSLLNYLRAKDSTYGVQPVLTDEIFEKTGSLDLLWAVFPLANPSDDEVKKNE